MKYSREIQQAESYVKKNSRRRIWKKILSTLASIVVFCTTYALILPAITMETDLHCDNTDHEHTLSCYADNTADVETSTIWENTFSHVELSGKWGEDVLAVARSQLGYTESVTNYVVLEDNETTKGYTRYGQWYGDPYKDWNSIFVSFCLNYAKVEEIPFEVGSLDTITASTMNGNSSFKAVGGYEPQAGDIIFLASDAGVSAQRVGIVVETVENQVTIIEGDSSDRVQTVNYNMDDASVLGYYSYGTAQEAYNLRRELRHETEYAGKGYNVKVAYSDMAEIPSNAALVAEEIFPEDERYQTYLSEVQATTDVQPELFRAFDIRFEVDGAEIEPMAEVSVSIQLAEVQEEDLSVAHFEDNGTISKPQTTTENTDEGDAVVSFNTESFSGFVVYASQILASEEFMHISFGAVTNPADGVNSYTDGEWLGFTNAYITDTYIASGDYDLDDSGNGRIYGALYGKISNATNSNVEANIRFNYREQPTTQIAGNDKGGLGYVAQAGDMVYLRVKTTYTSGGDTGGLFMVKYTVDSETTKEVHGEAQLISTGADGYSVYAVDISEAAGYTVDWITYRWYLEPNTDGSFIIDSVSIRQASPQSFQTHFYDENSPLAEAGDWADGNITSINYDADANNTNVTGGLIGGTVPTVNATGITSSYAKSLNYIIKEDDVVQFRIKTTIASGDTEGERYKITIGGRDMPLKGVSATSTIGGGSWGRDYYFSGTNSKSNGFLSQGSYIIATIEIGQYAGKTIDWLKFEWRGTYANGSSFSIDHIRIGALARTASTNANNGANGAVLNATPLTRTDDLPTTGEDKITFKLFNYNQNIATNSDDDINNNGLKGYFNFRGRSRINNPSNSRDQNAVTDKDGYVDALELEDADGDGYYENGTELVLDDAAIAKAPYSQTAITAGNYLARRTRVKPTLSNGYPALDGTIVKSVDRIIRDDGVFTYKTETEVLSAIDGASLGYLFGAGGNGVTQYNPVNTLLQYDESTATYFYDSAENAVDYDKTNNKFLVRNYVERSDELATYVTDTRSFGDFLPFTYWNGETIYSVNDDGTGATFNYDGDYEEDHWFGMTMTADFYQPENGINHLAETPDDMVFRFSGDDDVWVYIDDVLVLDFGGTHGVVSGEINFATGEVKQYLDWNGVGESNTATNYSTTIKAAFQEAGVEPEGGWNNNTFANYSSHSLDFFYLERGASVSNCKMEFNLMTLNEKSLIVGKQLTIDETGTEYEDFFQSAQTYRFRVLKATQQTDGTYTTDGTLYVPGNTEYTILETGEVRYTDADGYFYLAANEHAVFDNMLQYNDDSGVVGHYIVEECLSTNITGQYEDVRYSISGVGGTVTPEGEELVGFTTHQSPGFASDDTYTMVFQNQVDTSKLASLTIEKLVDSANDGDQWKTYKFYVDLDGKALPLNTPVTIVNPWGSYSSTSFIQHETASDGTTRSFVNLTPGNDYSVTIEGILAGTTYKVEEASDSIGEFVLSYDITGDGTENSSGDISYEIVNQDGSHYVTGELWTSAKVNVTATNAEPSAQATVEGTKILVNPDGNERTYKFYLQRITSNTDYTTQGDAMASTVTFPAGDKTENSEQTFSFTLDYPASSLSEGENTFWYKLTEDATTDDMTIFDTKSYLVKVVVNKSGTTITTPTVTVMDVNGNTVDTPTFTNMVAIIELPYTGGSGTQLYTLGGLLLMAVAFFMYKYNKRYKREGG